MSGPLDGPVEEVVLLDEDGRATGTAPKATVHHAATPLHLAFSCYVFDGDRLLVTRRALHKPTWPGAWTNTVCGHPAPGEPLDEAVRRRVRQELGIDLVDLRLVLPAFRYRAVMPDGTVENEMCPVLVASTTSTGSAVQPDEAEVADAVWEPWPAFRAGVLDGSREVSPWCREQVAALPPEPWTMPAADPSTLPAALR
jgi:isopentenyl-diphosphate delta-isomerase